MSSFLKRWSNRKAEASRGTTASPFPADTDQQQTAVATGTDTDPASLPDANDPETLAQRELAAKELEEKLAALPSLDEIGADTDIRPFMQDFVPAALRKAAMRRAWSADPIISTHLDVARDYAWEFNVGEGPLGFYNSLGSDAIKRGLDALEQIAPAPKTESAGVKTGEMADDATSAETEADVTDPELIAEVAEKRDLIPQTDRPLALRLSQKHGRALPD